MFEVGKYYINPYGVIRLVTAVGEKKLLAKSLKYYRNPCFKTVEHEHRMDSPECKSWKEHIPPAETEYKGKPIHLMSTKELREAMEELIGKQHDQNNQ